MEDMKLTDEAIYPEMRIAQHNVGELEISTMAFIGSFPENHVRFAHKITVRAASQKEEGWGKKIFEGSLAELIALVKEANLAREKV